VSIYWKFQETKNKEIWCLQFFATNVKRAKQTKQAKKSGRFQEKGSRVCMDVCL